MTKWFKKQSKQREALHNPALSQPQIEDNLLSSIHSKKILLKQLKPQCLKLCVSSKCPDLACLCQAPSASNLSNRERSAVTTVFDSARQNPLSFAKSRAQMSLWYRVKYLVILEGERVIKTGTRVSDYSRRFNTFIVAEFQAAVYRAVLKLMWKFRTAWWNFHQTAFSVKVRIEVILWCTSKRR